MPQTPLKYRADLQGLRAVAITLVVLAHAGMPGFSGGFVGVDIFFVLSGYLITGLLIREYLSSGRIGLLAFIARRLRRLLPALLAMLILVMLMGSVLLSSHEFAEQTASVGYASMWMSNLFFAFTTFDYFSELHFRDLFLHTWSLGVEEQYYLFWPALSILILYFAKQHSFLWDIRRFLLFSFGVLFACSFALSLYWSSTTPLWAFYLMPSRIWQFALGAAVFVWFEVDYQPSKVASDAKLSFWTREYGAAGMLLIIGSAVFLHPGMVYPGIWALLPSVGAAMVIIAGEHSNHGGISKALSHQGIVWIGDRSYSWYLWHWPLLMLGFAWGLKGNPTATIGLVSLSLLLAMVSYRRVELPFWKGHFSGISPTRTVSFSVLGIAVIAISLIQMNHAYHDSDERGAQLARAYRDDMPAINCDSWYRDATVQPCIFGESDARKTAVLMGDSIGAQWYSFLPKLFKTSEWRLIVLTKSSCAIVDEDYIGPTGVIYQVCTDWRNNAISYLEAIKPDIVFFGNAAYSFSHKQWIAGTRRILEKLTKVSDHVIVIPGTPKLSFDGPGCLERWLARHEYGSTPTESACGEQMVSEQSSQVARYLEEAVTPFDNAKVLNLNDLVCPNGYCAARNAAGLVVFRDQQHLTDSFVRSQVPLIKQRLLKFELGSLLQK